MPINLVMPHFKNIHGFNEKVPKEHNSTHDLILNVLLK